MNKFIIFALLFVFVLNDDLSDYIYTGDKADDWNGYDDDKASVENCNSITFSDSDYKCCFESGKAPYGDDYKECGAYKKSKVKKIVDLMEKGGYKDLSIDCSSNYLSKALIILLSLLF